MKCKICDMKAECKVSLGKHMLKEHTTIPQVDRLDDSGEKGLDPCPLCRDARQVPDLGECGKWGFHGVGFSGGNCVTCHLILNIKGADGCEDICNDHIILISLCSLQKCLVKKINPASSLERVESLIPPPR